MPSVFRFIAQMSITASYVIAAVLILRLLLRRFPRKYSYYLWYGVLFRLCCPFSFSSAFSIFNLNMKKGESVVIDLSSVPVSTVRTPDAAPVIVDLGVTRATETVNQILAPAKAAPQAVPVTPAVPVIPAPVSPAVPGVPAIPAAPAVPDAASAASASGPDPMLILSIIWLAGMLALAAYSLISYFRLRKSVRFSAPLYDNIRQADIRSPFLLGLIHPVIYMPFGLSGSAFELALAHERCHLKRKDNWVRALSYILLCVHWMNPLCWAACHYMIKDMEISCDEYVLSGDADIRGSYSSALLAAAEEKGNHIYHTVSFGGTNMKERIRNIMKFRRKNKLLSVAACVLCIAMLAACTFNGKHMAAPNTTVPENKEIPDNTEVSDNTGASDNTVMPIDTTAYLRIPTGGAEYVPGKMQQAVQGPSHLLAHDRIYFWDGCLYENRIIGYNLKYQDLSGSRQSEYLCSRPDCRHNYSGCSAFFKTEGRLMYYAKEDRLLLFDFESGSLLGLKEDRSGWDELLFVGRDYLNSFYDENSIQMLDSKLYLPFVEQKSIDDRPQEILELDIEAKTHRVIHSFEPNQRICGGFDKYIILEQKIRSDKNDELSFAAAFNCRYDLLDARTGKTRNVLTAELPFASCVYGHNVMYLIWDGARFVSHNYDLLTGEEHSVPVSDLPEHLSESPNLSNKWSMPLFALDETHFVLAYAEFVKGSDGAIKNDQFGQPEPLKDHVCIIDTESGSAFDYSGFDVTVRKYAETESMFYYTLNYDSSKVYSISKEDLTGRR